jgi:hypothetical protein
VARAQRASRVVRIGFVGFVSENDQNGLDRARVFRRGLERLGWAPMIDYYRGVFDVERAPRAAADVLRFRPDVIVSSWHACSLLAMLTHAGLIFGLSFDQPVAIMRGGPTAYRGADDA